MFRSDEEIKQIIEKEISREENIDASKITIEVKNGVVTLTGEVPTAATQSSANWITTAISGVSDVVNHLTVRQPATLTMSSGEKKEGGK